EQNRQDDHVRLDGFLQCLGGDRGPDRLRLRQQGFGWPPTGDRDFDVVAGESAGEGLAYRAETDDGVAHDIVLFSTGMEWSGPNGACLSVVIPAKAGIQCLARAIRV